jgi:hypothetical protein
MGVQAVNFLIRQALIDSPLLRGNQRVIEILRKYGLPLTITTSVDGVQLQWVGDDGVSETVVIQDRDAKNS